MTAMTILGQDWSGDSLWIAFGFDGGAESEINVTPAELAVARRSVQRGYSARLHDRWVDESQITDLIKAMDSPQPYWPPVLCEDGDCGTEATETVECRKVCHGHAMSYTVREEGQ